VQIKIVVENPTALGRNLVRQRAANRLVRDGRAIWTIPDKRIRITRLDDATLQSAVGYDADTATKSARLRQIQGLPCLKPMELLVVRRKRHA
jgi:hypothetical protein